MEIKNPQAWFFVVLLLATLALTFFLFLPYLNALILAVSFYIIFSPMHDTLLKWFRGRGVFAAMTTVVVAIVIVFAPLVFLGYEVVQEVRQVPRLQATGLVQLEERIQHYFPSINLNLDARLHEFINSFVSNIGSLFSSVSVAMLALFVSAFALYYLFKEGKALRALIVRVSPLPDRFNEQILDRLGASTRSVIRGTLLVAVVQATTAGIGMWLFGIPNPIFWGVVCIFAALIPAIGTALILVPAALYLFIMNDPVGGIALVAWATFITGTIDNVIRPYVFERSIHLHPFLILLSVLGGLALFGPIGFLTGPLILSFLFALVDIYPDIMGKRPRQGSASA